LKNYFSSKLFLYFMELKFIIFLIIGIVTFAIYYLLLWIFYEEAKLYYMFAVGCSYLIAVSFHFISNKILTFKNKENIKNQIWKYILLSIFNFFMQILIIKYLFEILSINFYLSALCGLIATMFSGFTIMKLSVFKESK
jgi:putative flippase GtrA